MNVYQLSFISADCIPINLDFVSILIVYSSFRMNKSLRSWRCYSVFRCAKNKLVTSLIIFLLFIITNFNDRITRRILHWMSYKYNWSVFESDQASWQVQTMFLRQHARRIPSRRQGIWLTKVDCSINDEIYWWHSMTSYHPKQSKSHPSIRVVEIFFSLPRW